MRDFHNGVKCFFPFKASTFSINLFKVEKKGLNLSDDRDMKRVKAVSFPVRLWICLKVVGLGMLGMVLI